MSYATEHRRKYAADYSRKWRAAHPEAAVAAKQRFYAKKAAEYGCSIEEAPAIYHKAWYTQNKERAQEYRKRKAIRDAKAKLLQV